MSQIIRRIERQAGIPDLSGVLADGIEAADLHSLLQEVYRRRSRRRTPTAVRQDYESSRFVRPASTDPRLLLEWDRLAFSQLPDSFEPIELSPLSPLATNAAVAIVSQDQSLVTARNVEVVSDPTSVLALECAVRRRALLAEDDRSGAAVKLAASHRALRPQAHADPQMLTHFRLFCLCTASRDVGSNRFELEALLEHLGFYLRALQTYVRGGSVLRVTITDLIGDPPRHQWECEVMDSLRRDFPGVECGYDQARTTGRGYYREVCFHIEEVSSGSPLQLADGGAVDWTAKLLSNSKERLFISGIGSERVCSLRNGPAR